MAERHTGLVHDDFSELERRAASLEGAIREKQSIVEALTERLQPDETTLRALAAITKEQEGALNRLWVDAIGPTDELFAGGTLSIDEMVRRTTVLVKGLGWLESDGGSEEVQFAAELAATAELLPKLQKPGVAFAVFIDNDFKLRETQGAAYPRVGNFVRHLNVVIPANAPIGFADERGVDPLAVAVGEAAIVERYKEELPRIIEKAAVPKSADKGFYFSQYPDSNKVIDCARWGRQMQASGYVSNDDELQELIVTSQEPLLNYITGAVPVLGNHAQDADEIGQFIYALKEVRHLHPEVIESSAQLLAETVVNCKDERELQRCIEVVQVALLTASEAPRDEIPHDQYVRKAEAYLRAAQMVRDAHVRQMANAVQ